jgi:hypothetical protein
MEPELLVVAFRFHYERVAFPVTAGIAEVGGDAVFVGLWKGSAVRVNDAPTARPSAEDDYDLFLVGNFQKLEAVRSLELAGTAWRQAPRVRIVLLTGALADLIE